MSEEKQQPSGPPNFNDLEKEVLKFWDENKIFEKSLEQTKTGEPFIFYDGPPFATGLPHYGSILPSVIKDAVPRYQTMKGRFVRRRWGWDCHGLPIENIVEQKLKISGKKQIEEIGVEKFNQECRENVLRYAEEWGKTIKRVARWVDFDNSYKTMDTSYMESVWWALKQIWNKGLIYEDRKVLLYCSRCETPISNFEVAMDNSYREVTEESVYAKFKLPKGQRIINDLTNDNTYALAWTTTPWTLPGNTSLNIGPEITYVMIEQEARNHAEAAAPTLVSESRTASVGTGAESSAFAEASADRRGKTKERYILAKDRLSVIEGEYEMVTEFPAAALEGLLYEPLYPGVVASRNHAENTAAAQSRGSGDSSKAHKIYVADFVTTTDGTGIVHNAALYGEEDYQLAKEKNLPKEDMLDHQGRYLNQPNISEHLRGVFFKDADKIVLKELKANNLVYKTESYLHSYPHCYRCGTPLFYNALPAWFINIQEIKGDLLKNNEAINWYPEHLKDGRFKQGIENAPDWNISRNRYWATPLPFWKCENKECRNVVCVGSINELKEKSLNYSEVYPDTQTQIDLHKPYIDKIRFKCEKCGGPMNRVPEVVDCWVESGSMPFAELHAPFENQDLFEKRFPSDFVVEYIPQTRAWFYVMHVISTILFGHAPFKNVVTTGTILAEDGSKMSKSKNNYPDPNLVIEKYGADALRFYLLSSPVVTGEDLNFSEKGVLEISRKVNALIYNCWSFLRLYERRKLEYHKVGQSENVLDKWVMARLSELHKSVTGNLDNYNTVRAGKEIIDFINDLSTWYVRRSRDRIKLGGEDGHNSLVTLSFVLSELAKLLAPFMPFLSEFIYRDLTGKDSVHLESWTPALDAADGQLLTNMEIVREIVSLGLAVRKQKSLPVRQPLANFAFELQDEKTLLSSELVELILAELNVKKLDNALLDKDLRPEGVEVLPGTKFVKNFYLDLNLTPELKQEGVARELERQVQDLRKKSGLKVGELVDLYYNTQDESLESSLLSGLDRKKTFVNQINKSLEVEVDFEIQAEISGKPIWLGMIKI